MSHVISPLWFYYKCRNNLILFFWTLVVLLQSPRILSLYPTPLKLPWNTPHLSTLTGSKQLRTSKITHKYYKHPYNENGTLHWVDKNNELLYMTFPGRLELYGKYNKTGPYFSLMENQVSLFSSFIFLIFNIILEDNYSFIGKTQGCLSTSTSHHTLQS